MEKLLIMIAPVGSVTCHTSSGIGRHCQNSKASARLEHSTYVARSIAAGMNCVHHRLNWLRAMALCCTARS